MICNISNIISPDWFPNWNIRNCSLITIFPYLLYAYYCSSVKRPVPTLDFQEDLNQAKQSRRAVFITTRVDNENYDGFIHYPALCKWINTAHLNRGTQDREGQRGASVTLVKTETYWLSMLLKVANGQKNLLSGSTSLARCSTWPSLQKKENLAKK